MVKLSKKAPAKINLTLDVLGKRADGYHEVKMVMAQVDLADRLEFERRKDGKIVVQMSEGFLPEDHRNLAYQAAKLLKDKYRIACGVSIFIHKNIPVAAGLAGGSSDAAATLRGMNELWEIGADMEELAEIGALIGSDVSFCVHGGTAIATGRGEQIEHIDPPPSCWVILAKPPIGVSTGEIYRRIDAAKKRQEMTPAMVEAIRNNNYEQLCRSLSNTLEEVTLPLYPEVGQIKARMLDSGVDAALMSGSGPTVFGLVDKESKVTRVYNALRGFCSQVYAVRLLNDRNA